MATEPLTQTACDRALREAMDAEIARRRPASQWTLEIDREVWRAAEVYAMGARSISVAMIGLYAWATRNAVEGRLGAMRKAGGPDGLWP
jgi:hypothetical protein